MCWRSTPSRSIRFRYSVNTATPPNGVTARSVSRSFSRSPVSRALISRGIALSDERSSILLLSQADACHSKLQASDFGLSELGIELPDQLKINQECSADF